ncbi:MAG: hypothetical protein KGO49_10900 [Gammaproteobacteria bacterium]|nr:hypothetical protein [Gammaproteobacteria bacterium]
MSFASTPDLVKWTDPTPSALQPFDGNAEALAELAGSSLLFYPQPKKTVTLPYNKGPKTYTNVQYVTGAIVVSATGDQVEKLLSDYVGYSKLFPKITEAVVQANEQQGDFARDSNASIRTIVQYNMRIKIPIPLLSFNENILLQHERTHNSISTLILDSPVQYGSGKFEWFPLKNGKTLVTLTQWGDLDHPKGFLVSTILSAMPEIKTAIPNSVEGFVLESLRQRFEPNFTAKALPMDNIIPVMNLTSEQESQIVKLLKQGGVVQFSHQPAWLAKKDRAEKLWFVSSFYNMPAPLMKTKDAFANPKNFPNIYRQVRSVTSTPLADNGSQNDIKIGLGLGVISIPMHIQMAYQPEASNNGVRFYTTGGDVEFIQGRFQFKALDNKNTLVGLTAGSHLGDNPPFLLRIGKNLPYLDYLPTVGSAAVVFDKARIWLLK